MRHLYSVTIPRSEWRLKAGFMFTISVPVLGPYDHRSCTLLKSENNIVVSHTSRIGSDHCETLATIEMPLWGVVDVGDNGISLKSDKINCCNFELVDDDDNEEIIASEGAEDEVKLNAGAFFDARGRKIDDKK